MRVLRFSHDYLLNVGGLMVNLRGLNRELARCGVEVDHAFLVGEHDVEVLVESGRLLKMGDGYVQRDAMVNLHPCIVPNRSPTVPDGDSSAALELFDKRFKGILRDRCPDVVHVHLVKHQVQLRALEIAAEWGARTAMSHHEGFPETEAADELTQRGALLADLRFSITDYASRSIRSRPVDYVGFYVDTIFWDPARIRRHEVSEWREYIRSHGTVDQVFVYPARFIRRKNHRTLIQAAALLKSGSVGSPRLEFRVLLVGETIHRHLDYLREMKELAYELGVEKEVLFVDVQPREALRALLAIADGVVYPAINEGAGRSHLEGMLVGACPVVADDAGLAHYVRHGVNGLTFSPDSPEELAVHLEQFFTRRSWIGELTRNGREVAKKLTLNQYALDHIAMYKGSGAASGESPESGAKIKTASCTQSKSADCRRGVFNFSSAVLVIDLDYCLIRPEPLCIDAPTAFPLEGSAVIRVPSEADRSYQIRPGLDDLAAIVKYPWARRLVVSMADQQKVNEVCEQLYVGGASLAQIADACIGKEFLKAFAAAKDQFLPLENQTSWHNPKGRLVRAKPSDVASIANFAAVRSVLAGKGMREFGAELFELQGLRPYVVWVDDQPNLAGDAARVAHFPVLHFCDVEEFRDLIPTKTNYSVSAFNTLEVLWKIAHRPFGYLRFLLEEFEDWEKFKSVLYVEHELLRALSAAENNMQFKWILRESWGRRVHGRYFRFAYDDGALRAQVIREHARLYRDISRYEVASDLSEDSRVLFLGRDMDYAFEVISEDFPTAIESRRFALLPISRACVSNSDPQSIADVIVEAFGECGDGFQLVIYDVGFHGNIIHRLTEIMRQDPRTRSIIVRGKLITKCSCIPGYGINCVGEGLILTGPNGSYRPSRNLGLSIERLPHRTGSVSTLTQALNGFRFHYNEHNPEEGNQAAELSDLLSAIYQAGCADSHGTPGSEAADAARRVVKEHRRLLNAFRHALGEAIDRGVGYDDGSLLKVVVVGSGGDLLRALAAFPAVNELVFASEGGLQAVGRLLSRVELVDETVALVSEFLTAAADSRRRAVTGTGARMAPHRSVTLLALRCLSVLGLLPGRTVTDACMPEEESLHQCDTELGRTNAVQRRLTLWPYAAAAVDSYALYQSLEKLNPDQSLIVMPRKNEALRIFGNHLRPVQQKFRTVWADAL